MYCSFKWEYISRLRDLHSHHGTQSEAINRTNEWKKSERRGCPIVMTYDACGCRSFICARALGGLKKAQDGLSRGSLISRGFRGLISETPLWPEKPGKLKTSGVTKDDVIFIFLRRCRFPCWVHHYHHAVSTGRGTAHSRSCCNRRYSYCVILTQHVANQSNVDRF
jgi:hypothetical protein